MTLRAYASRFVLLLGLVAASASVAGAAPAGPADSAASLAQQVTRRFDVLIIQHGLVLKPKGAMAGARSIELAEGAIAIDGQPVTGAELKRKLGADADLVLRLSYLDDEARRTAFGPAGEPAPPRAPVAPTAPVPPAAPKAPEPLAAPEPPPAPEPPTPPARVRSGRHSDARIKVGGNLTVDPDEVVGDSVVVIGGSAHINGQVDGDVVVIAGTAQLGPTADVQRDVTVVGGTLEKDPAARIGGRVNEVGLGDIAIDGNRVGRRLGRMQRFPGLSFGLGNRFALASTVGRYLVLCVFVCLVLLASLTYTQGVGARAVAEPVKAGFVGLLSQVLFVPMLVIVIVGMVVTIVGIPLLALVPFGLLAMAVFFVVGFAAIASAVGQAAIERTGGTALNPYLTAIVGITVLLAPVFLARLLGVAGGVLYPLSALLLGLGLFLEYLAWTVGFGAVVLQRFDRRWVRPAVPPAPPTPPAEPPVEPPAPFTPGMLG